MYVCARARARMQMSLLIFFGKSVQTYAKISYRQVIQTFLNLNKKEKEEFLPIKICFAFLKYQDYSKIFECYSNVNLLIKCTFAKFYNLSEVHVPTHCPFVLCYNVNCDFNAFPRSRQELHAREQYDTSTE